MKRFKEHVKEDLNTMGVGVTTSNSPEDGNIGAHNIQDPAVLQKVNAYVGSIGDGAVSYTHLTLPTTPYV